METSMYKLVHAVHPVLPESTDFQTKDDVYFSIASDNN